MTGTILVSWQVAPLSLPQAQRHCSNCGRPRPFGCSGKVRLNANGRRLDAWLIYKCSACDQTWNLALLDRVPVAEVPPADLAAMQISDPAWVHARAFDLAALRRHAVQAILPTDLTVAKGLPSAANADWSRIALTIKALWPVGLRLDRLLAQELGLSRSLLATLQASGGICVAKGPRQAFRTPLAGSILVLFDFDRIAESLRPGLAGAFGLPPPVPDA